MSKLPFQKVKKLTHPCDCHKIIRSKIVSNQCPVSPPTSLGEEPGFKAVACPFESSYKGDAIEVLA